MNKVIFFGISTVLVVLAAFFLQTAITLNSDVSLLLREAHLFIMGGKYATDFFETNPPMIFYLYSPIHVLHAITALDIAKSAYLYIISLALVSVGCCYRLINKIVKKEDAFVMYAFLYALLFALFILPATEFGQREHVFLILMLPYVLAVVCVVEKKQIRPIFSFFIGIMMGLGVGLKPYFLMPLVLIEIYLMVVKRSLWSWVRVASLACASVLIVYLSSILIWQSNYIKIILPLIHHFYFVSIQQAWVDILLRPTVLFCVFIAGFYFFWRDKKYYHLITVLEIVLIGTIAAFIVTHTGWFYHVIPAMGLGCLLISIYMALFFLSYTQKKRLKKREFILILASWVMIFLYLSIVVWYCFNIIITENHTVLFLSLLLILILCQIIPLFIVFQRWRQPIVFHWLI